MWLSGVRRFVGLLTILAATAACGLLRADNTLRVPTVHVPASAGEIEIPVLLDHPGDDVTGLVTGLDYDEDIFALAGVEIDGAAAEGRLDGFWVYPGNGSAGFHVIFSPPLPACVGQVVARVRLEVKGAAALEEIQRYPMTLHANSEVYVEEFAPAGVALESGAVEVHPENEIALGVATVEEGSDTASVPVYLTNQEPVADISLGVHYDETALSLKAVRPTVELRQAEPTSLKIFTLVGGLPVVRIEFRGESRMEPGALQPILFLDFKIKMLSAPLPVGTFIPLEVREPVVRIGDATGILVRDGGIEVVPFGFIRGDVNLDGAVRLDDAQILLAHLFGKRALSGQCLDAADLDDDGAITLSDAVRLLAVLYLPGVHPAPPFPARGPDPTDDTLECHPE